MAQPQHYRSESWQNMQPTPVYQAPPAWGVTITLKDIYDNQQHTNTQLGALTARVDPLVERLAHAERDIEQLKAARWPQRSVSMLGTVISGAVSAAAVVVAIIAIVVSR